MALGEYLAGLNLAPGVTQKLTGLAATPPPPAAPPPASTDDNADYLPPTAAEMVRYGTSPEMANRLVNAQNAVAASGGAKSPSAPSAQPGWTPEGEKKEVAAAARSSALAGATPQGPAGDDGFPTYRDLSAPAPGQGPATAGPSYTVPAHWSPTSRSESTSRTDLDPSLLNTGAYHRDAAAGHRMIEGDQRLEAAQMQGQADAVYAAANAAASQQAAARTAQIQQQRQAYVESEKQKLDQLSQKAMQQVDPEAAKGSAGAQLFAAIGIALGQFGASLNGGQNAALAIVNANIDRRIKAQETNIGNAHKALGNEQSLYKDSLGEFGDKERAALATKVQYLDQVKAMADQQYAAAKNKSNEASYHGFVASVNDERAKAADDLAKLTGIKVDTQGVEHYQQAQQVGGPGAGALGKEKLFVPALGGYARDEETARKLNAHGSLRTQVNEDLHEIHSLLDESKHLSSITDYGRMQEVRQRIDALKHGILQKTTVLADQGAMSNGDKDVAEARSALMHLDPQGQTDAQITRAQKGLVSVAKGHQRDARLEGEANGIQLGTEQYRTGPNGPEAVAKLAGQNKLVTKKTEGVDDLVQAPKGQSQRDVPPVQGR